MKKLWHGFILAIFLAGLLVAPISADVNYLFQVPVANVILYINSDGTASVDYTYEFINDQGAHIIDYVDIGIPTTEYKMSSITAEINGQKITDIATSPITQPGIALGLGSNSIQPGQKGTVHANIGVVQGMIFPSTSQEKVPYASFQFSPNWFDSASVHGNTKLTVTLILPPGMTSDQPRYYPVQNWPGQKDPVSKIDDQGRVNYQWTTDTANSGTQYIFGGAFPLSLVPTNSIVTTLAVGTGTGSGSTSFSGIFNLISGNFCCFGIALFWIGIIAFSFYQSQHRKLQYLSPKVSIEGHGIKRGLTAIEAAILMEQPMDKILTMILFSVVKKGAAKVISKEPMQIEITTPQPADLRAYEVDFLNAFEVKSEDKRRVQLQELMVNIIKSVTEKIKGFSLKETVEYYKGIVEKAWQFVGEADTPEVKMQRLDEALDWTILDHKFSDRSEQVFGQGPVFVPIWWGRMDPTFHQNSIPAASAGSIPGIPAGSSPVSLPNLPGSVFAASVVNNIQNFSSKVLGNLSNFTGNVTNKTNPVPKSSGRGFSGGSHCACACACAGCACACAGGGR